MIAADVYNRFVTNAQSEDIAERWNSVYPAMRTILDTVIQAQRGAERQTVDVARLERVRREMGQQHRGDFKECTRSPGSFSICAGYSQVREVLAVTSIGHPDAGAVHRLAGELADVVASATKGRQLEWEAERGAVPAQPVDGGRHERADSERTERGTR